MKGGFPLSAPLALLAITFMFGVFAAAPVAMFTSAGWSVMTGSMAATGGMLIGILVPWETVRSMSGRIGSWGESGCVPWSVAM